jgi:hypothetical protein
MNKLSHGQKLSFKIDVDHVNFAVAASNAKLAYLTSVGLLDYQQIPTVSKKHYFLSSICLTCYKNVQ